MVQNQGTMTAHLWSNMATQLFLFAYERNHSTIIQFIQGSFNHFTLFFADPLFVLFNLADYFIQKPLEQFWSSGFTSHCVIPKFTCLAIRTSLGFGASHCAALKFEAQLKYTFIYSHLKTSLEESKKKKSYQ